MRAALYIIVIFIVTLITSCSSTYSAFQREYTDKDYGNFTIGTAVDSPSFSLVDTNRTDVAVSKKVSPDSAKVRFQSVLENEIMSETKFGAAVRMSNESSRLLCQENIQPDSAVSLKSINGMEPAFSLSFEKVKIVLSEYFVSKTGIQSFSPAVLAVTTAIALANLEKYQKTEIDADYRIWDVQKRRILKSGSVYVSCAVPAAEIHGGDINLTGGIVKELVENIFQKTPFNISRTKNRMQEY